MLIFSAITPHPPLLIPSIGRENLEVIKKTREAMEKLSWDLYSLKPETIIIISPHGELNPDKITINQSPHLEADFTRFGDLITKLEFSGDMGLAYQIYENFETKMPMQLIHEEKLDHGCSVPLYYLMQNLKQTKIIPLYYSLQDLKTHFEFGKKLKEIIQNSNKRIAVVASGDLSHCLTPDAPAGYSQVGKKFDKQLIDFLKQKKIDEIIKFNPEFAKQAGECGLRSIAILLGIISEMNLTPEFLSYEGTFGVGYLVMEFV